jgi:hypothetical protein
MLKSESGSPPGEDLLDKIEGDLTIVIKYDSGIPFNVS